MKTIIFLYDYSYLNESIEKKCTDYYKILIVQKNKYKDSKIKRKIFDEIVRMCLKTKNCIKSKFLLKFKKNPGDYYYGTKALRNVRRTMDTNKRFIPSS
ncbi:MAG: hypothetical protein LBQ71_01560 [Hungatella sp.]|nr:hypothetical protein [Hungatella sp.]